MRTFTMIHSPLELLPDRRDTNFSFHIIPAHQQDTGSCIPCSTKSNPFYNIFPRKILWLCPGDKRSSHEHFDGLVHDCSNSSALAMELLQSCTEPSICTVLVPANYSFYCPHRQGKLTVLRNVSLSVAYRYVQAIAPVPPSRYGANYGCLGPVVWSLNHSLWKRRTTLSYTFNTMAADDLVM